MRLLQGVILISIAGMGLISHAKTSDTSYPVIRGEAQVGSGKTWVTTNQLAPGQWLRASNNETTVQLPGMMVRMASGTQIQVARSKQGSTLKSSGGRIYVKLDQDSAWTVTSEHSQVASTGGEFVLDSDSDQVYLIKGSATLNGPEKAPRALQNWSNKPAKVALDGPDVRRRNRNRKRFTQGEENKGKRIGEDETPSPSPTVTQSPAYTPSPTPTAPNPSPSPPPTGQTPPVIEEGVGPWPVVGGLLGAGALAFVATRGGGGGGEPNQVVVPSSP